MAEIQLRATESERSDSSESSEAETPCPKRRKISTGTEDIRIEEAAVEEVEVTEGWIQEGDNIKCNVPECDRESFS